MTNDGSISRRALIAGAAVAAGAAVGIPALVSLRSRDREEAPAPAPPDAEKTAAPSNRIALGFIGMGKECTSKNLKVFLGQPDTQVVAVCDVDAERANNARDMVAQHHERRGKSGTFRGCDVTGDWRDIIARNDIDAVVITTPDHWHVLPAIAAAKANKDVFCEKPVSLTVREGRALSDTMRRYGRVFQTGSENRSKRAFLRACELVRNGRIGKLHTIYTQIYRGHGMDEAVQTVNPAPVPVPEGFDYDMWLGQAPSAPYTPARCHVMFRYVLDYSGGNLTDWGSHITDIAQWGNGTELSGPVSVEGRGEFPADGIYNVATDWELTYEYADGVKLVSKSGGFSVRFEGTEGWVQADWDRVEASSNRILSSVIGPEETHLRTCAMGEHRDFLNCVKSRRATYAPAEIGHRTATVAHIGNIAMILGRKLRWDPDMERFANDPEADRMLSRTMRSPWRLEG